MKQLKRGKKVKLFYRRIYLPKFVDCVGLCYESL